MTADHESASPPLCCVVTTVSELRAMLARERAAGRKIGLVPTMGALHEGHLSLVDAARQQCDVVVASVFVNPTQFGPGEDFERYPRNLERDVELLALRGVRIVFAPSTAEVYRPGNTTFVDVGTISDRFEGECRPGHFRGVATVVLKLLLMVQPDSAFFGQKDYQQSLVIRRLVDDLDVPVKVHVCATLREPDGLAMSSRNVYLSAADRRAALVLSRSLAQACALFAGGERDAGTIKQAMLATIAEAPALSLDYLALADADTLADVASVTPHTVAVIAARLPHVRLIDNCFLWQSPGERT